MNLNKAPMHQDVIYFEREKDDVVVEIAMQYSDAYNETIFTFANNINTHEGGTHLSGFRSALTRTVNAYAKNNKLIKDDKQAMSGDDIREGVTAVISVKIPDPQFEGQTKTKLGNGEVEGIVQSVVNEELGIYFEENPSVARTIIEKAVVMTRARLAAKKHAIWRVVKARWNRADYQENWRIVQAAILREQNCLLSKVTLRVDRKARSRPRISGDFAC